MVLRILMLPGLGQNVSILRTKFATIEKFLGSDIETVYLEPPHVLRGGDPTGAPASSVTPDSEALRQWYEPSQDLNTYYGIELGVSTLRDFLAKQEKPFDAVLGFSQGAGMAGLLVALTEHPESYPDFLVDGKSPHPPFKFAVYVSGFRALDAKVAPAFTHGKLKTPSLHIIGRNDVVVSNKRSQTLLDACESPRAEWHDGGHFIPSKTSWRNFFKAYFAAFEEGSKVTPESVPSPTLGSAVSSAAGTPLTTRPSSPLLE